MENPIPIPAPFARFNPPSLPASIHLLAGGGVFKSGKPATDPGAGGSRYRGSRPEELGHPSLAGYWPGDVDCHQAPDSFAALHGSNITVYAILPPGEFNPGRFFSTLAILVVVSLLLSFLWTLDDLGVRHYNKKTHEVKMIGRYLGILLPIFFGFYGIINLFEDNARFLAAQYIAQMVVVLYPPFVVFNVLHARYLAKREEVLLKSLKVATGFTLVNGKEAGISKA